MSNQLQFVRQTAAACLAFGFIASLLPGLAVAQDLSTRESLDKDWEWVREEPREWQWNEGVLRLRTQPGGVWGPTEPARNVLVSRSTIAGKGSVEALIGLENPIRKWEQAGLLVYRDDDHFVKLIVEFIEGKYYVVMAWELGKQSKVVAKVETGLQEAWLRCEVDGNKVRGLWRRHGDSQWTEAAVCEFPEDLKRRFAIFTQTGPEKEVRWATVKGVKGTIIQGHAARWPQFRGPNRDGKSPETGLLKKWPEAGPRLIGTISGVGGGFSSPVIAGENIYISGKVGDDLKIFCFDGTGRKIWERTHGPAFSEPDAPHSPYPGARATPTIDGDMVYLLGGLGRLTAYRTSDGHPVWSVDVVSELGGRVPPWGYAESVLIDGGKLIFAPGSETKGTFAALNKKTGQVLWQSADVTERAEYGSCILIETNNVRQVVTMSRGGLVAVSPDNGKLLWRYNRVAKMATPETTTAHGNSPVYADGYVFEATSYHTRGGCAVSLKPGPDGVEAELAWEDSKLNCEHGGYVTVNGHIYMNQGVGWSCLELKTGEEQWFGRGPGRGSIIYADGMLYCLGDKGRMGLIEASPGEFQLVSTFDLPRGEGPCWTHPVIAGGKLYLRWNSNLYIYDIKE